MITIVGAGKVYRVSAFDIFKDHTSYVVLMDLNAQLVRVEIWIWCRMRQLSNLIGKSVENNYFGEMEGSELVIVSVGQGKKPGMNRIDPININAKIIRSIVKEVAKYASDWTLMIVANPVN